MNKSANKTYQIANRIETVCCLVLIVSIISSFACMLMKYEGLGAWITITCLLISTFVGLMANVIKEFIKTVEDDYNSVTK